MNTYKLLLHLYPSSFRAQYGAEMAEIFADRLVQSKQPWLRFVLWLSTFFDVLWNAALLHWEITRRDLYHSARSLLRSPGFTITAILLITIGIGANVAVFTLTNFVLIRPLPFAHPEQLARVWEQHVGYSQMELSPANYRDLKAASRSFTDLAGYSESSVNLVGEGEPRRIDGASVTGNLFATLAAPPLLGRVFTQEDDRKEAPGTVVLSYALWQSAFAGDPGIVGKHIDLDNSSYTVIGVMPSDFLFPQRDTLLWTPYRMWEEDFKDRNNNYMVGIARLKPHVSLSQAASETALIAARLRSQYAKENESVGMIALPLQEDLTADSKLLLKGLCGAALCVLVIACGNLGNLLLVRSLKRQRELSIRLSLGASRRNLARQLVVESALLGLAGGACATVVAVASLPLLSHLVPTQLPIQQVPPVDVPMLLMALGLTIVTVIAFGVTPALWASRKAGYENLRVGVTAGSSRQQRGRSALVIAEVVASVVLLVISGLLLRSLWRIQATDPGFRVNGILSVRTQLPFPKYNRTALRDIFYNKVVTEVRRLPGVSDAAYISNMPMTWGGGIWPVEVDGQSQIRVASNSASMRFVTPGLFSTLGIPLRAGRSIAESDTADRPYVAVVSQSFVRRYWPDKQPLGRHFKFAFHDREVVGVVGDIRARGLERTSEPQVYLSAKQDPDDGFTFYAPRDLVIASSQKPEQLLPAIREIVHAADPEQPISNVRTMEQVVANGMQSRSVQISVLALFTGVAVCLAGLGIYGVLAFTVSMREQEFGIRLALGAERKHIFNMVLRHGLLLATAGLLPGLLLAYLAARLLQNLLAGVTPADTATFAVAAVLCFVTALLGTLLPAIRALRADPALVMRAE